MILSSQVQNLQNCLEEIVNEFTPKFVNKMHWIQLKYCVKKQEDFNVCKGLQERIRKSAMYVTHLGDFV